MAHIISLNGHTPRIHESAFIAPTATIIGDVTIGPESSIFYGCVLRADINAITIGARTNIQDNCVLHVDADAPCTLGDDVTVGHLALIHGTTIGNGTLVGMKAALLSRSSIGAGSLIAAGAVVLEDQHIGDKVLAAGVPATIKRELSDKQSQAFIPHAGRYVDLAKIHASQGQEISLEKVRYK